MIDEPTWAPRGPRPSRRRRRRATRVLVLTPVIAAVLVVQRPASDAIANLYHQHFVVNSHAYEAKYGHWQVLRIPGKDKVNAVHASLLHNGDVLIVAGSGNNAAMFAAGTFKSLLLDPATMKMKLIPTPVDMFCGGHVQLPDGNLLIAGGTKRYEVLASSVTNAGGAMEVKNESPRTGVTVAKGTIFDAPNGLAYRSELTIRVPPATKTIVPGGAKVTASEAEVWVDAVKKGRGSVIDMPEKYRIRGLRGAEARNVYGMGDPMTLNKQDFQGLKTAYIFDVKKERYERVEDMRYARWYPTLLELNTGTVMAMSGLDGAGQILNGENEYFDPSTLRWSDAPTHYFPTYPYVIQTDVRHGSLFYSGSNTGYGPADRGRTPGFWDLRTDRFTPVTGMADANMLETSNSVLLAPAQSQKVMVIGGGGVGQSPLSTSRTAIIDLAAAHPQWKAGPSLAHRTRYPSAVLLPDDDVFITGGSSGYRGEHASDNRDARLYDPTTGTLAFAADSLTGRDYHSEALLLPSGKVLSMGGNPLFEDKKDTISASNDFNQKITVYSPPYLFSHRARPSIAAGPTVMHRGGSSTVRLASDVAIGKVRLIHPSSVTHMTDVGQRSVAVRFTQDGNELHLTIPASSDLLPPGWFMLFATSSHGIPSRAFWVDVP